MTLKSWVCNFHAVFVHFVQIVPTSSIVNEAIKTISSQFIFFYKRFWVHQKHRNSKQMISTLFEFFACAKNRCLCWFLFAYFCFCWLVLIDLCFCTLKIFSQKKKKKKKINWLEIVLIASFTIPLTCTPINQPIKNVFVCTYFYLWSSVIIYFLWESFYLW